MDEIIRVPIKDVGRISVDVNRFGHGMEMTFAGMSEVWGSLGAVAPSDLRAVPPEEQKEKAEKPKAAAGAKKPPKGEAPAPEPEPEAKPEPVAKPEAKDGTKSAGSAISYENLTEAIVAKVSELKP